MEEKYLAVFGSYTHTTMLGKILSDRNIESEMIVTPSKISVGCSRAIRFSSKYYEQIQNIIRENALDCRGIFAKVSYKGYLTYVFV